MNCAEEIDSEQLTSDFYSLFRHSHIKSNERRKKDKPSKIKQNRSKGRKAYDIFPINIPCLEFLGNSSYFTVYASVRAVVLQCNFAEACRKFLTPIDEIESENEGSSSDANTTPVPIPRIIGIGIETVFQLIKESQTQYPELCIKALQALLDILEGQHPQSIRKDNAAVFDSMFSVLLKLSTSETDKEPRPSSSKQSSLLYNLTGIATSCLISLAIARGEAKYLLEAIVALFKCHPSLIAQELKNTYILKSLQLSIQAALVGRLNLPQWLNEGVPDSSVVDTFPVTFTKDPPGSVYNAKALASDGTYIYLHCSRGLFKIGTGAFGSIRGHVYASNENFHKQDKFWLGFCGYKLYYVIMKTPTICFLRIVHPETLEIESGYDLRIPMPENTPYSFFTDGENLGYILPTRDDAFLVRTLGKGEMSPANYCNEFDIRLVRKSVEVFGPGVWDSEISIRQINTGYDDDVAAISAGRDFAILRTTTGRLLYCGKSASLGQKASGASSGSSSSKWTELTLAKTQNFIQCAVGHDGIHAILLADDGSAYFVGTPKRGEDGDLGKPRRVAKASKPKKVSRMDGMDISFVACNNGTSAFVTRSGALYMFGKDTAHCDETGLVSSLHGVLVSQVAMGKAHTVILTGDGKIYTMGINNKGQCGRSRPAPRDEETVDDEDGEWDYVAGSSSGIGAAANEGLCLPGTHRWKHDKCMICPICRECTGYGSACISNLKPERNPGQECGCGVGDAGCEECGCCRACGREVLDDSDFVALEVPRDPRVHGPSKIRPLNDLPEEIPPRALAMGPYGLYEIDEVEPREEKLQSKLLKLKGKEIPLTAISPPTKLVIGIGSSNFVQVACGLYHSVFLDDKGNVYTCGSNSLGQLGVGDVAPRQVPIRIPFPSKTKIIQIAAGSYHTVCLDSEGIVYTAGSNTHNQLGRNEPDTDDALYACWNATMLPIQSIGSYISRRVTWIGANGDATFLTLESSLIGPTLLKKSTVTANKTVILIIPPPHNAQLSSCIIINRRDGSCSQFEGDSLWRSNTSAITLDPLYDFLWTYEWKTHEAKCHNIIGAFVRQPDVESNLLLCKPLFSLPSKKGATVKRWQVGLNFLACIDSLVSARILGLSVSTNDEPSDNSSNFHGKSSSRETNYSTVTRFEGIGSGWGYSNTSVDAIRFSTDTDILLAGVGLLGGTGEYSVQVKIFDLGPSGGGEVETDGEKVAQTEEQVYEVEPKQRYRCMLDEPIPILAGHWYVIAAFINGESGECGSDGLIQVVTDDRITFSFKSTKKSTNCTDVSAGQIPDLIYISPNSSNSNSNQPSTTSSLPHVHLLYKEFMTTFTPACLNLLNELFAWSRIQLMEIVPEMTSCIEKGALFHVLKNVACISLRLIDFSTNQAYPLRGCGKQGRPESQEMTIAIGDIRSMLQNMITSEKDIASEDEKIVADIEHITIQACTTFIHCFHVFYPTSYLKWECLKSITNLALEKGEDFMRLFGAVILSLCGCRGNLLSIFPVLSDHPQDLNSDGTTSGFFSFDNGRQNSVPNNKLLVSQMTARFGRDPLFLMKPWDIWMEFKNLLSIMEMCEKKSNDLQKAVAFHTSILIGRLMEELVNHSCGTYAELENLIGQTIVSTPCRFTRTNSSRTWNTGAGAADDVCFCVDQDGVSIFGACVYSGSGSYDYELELLQDVETNNPEKKPERPEDRWVVMECTHGSFDSDDCEGDIAEIRFAKPVHIKASVKYALRLKNHGARTCNGDAGVSTLRCSDGTTFTFSSCALSFNGTNQIRGQLPYILYFRNPDDSEARQKARSVAEMDARKSALRLCKSIFDETKERVEKSDELSIDAMQNLSNSTFVTSLLPCVIAHLHNLATADPRSSVSLLDIIRNVLPDVARMNIAMLKSSRRSSVEIKQDINAGVHYAWVESAHPYKSATLTQYRVIFPSSVQRMTVEFDPRCVTAQALDVLRVHIPFGSEPIDYSQFAEDDDYNSYMSVMDTYSGSEGWPIHAVVLPGNEILFSLETSSDSVRADKKEYFGFRCLVTGYEAKEVSGLARLELELCYLGGFCSYELMRKDVVLPPVSAEELEVTDNTKFSEEKILDICLRHHSLFSKGIGLEYFPTVQEALDGIVPLREKSKEREFIIEFIRRIPNTSGERLAKWLQPDSFVDPDKCQVVAPKEKLYRGRSTTLTFITKDQYGEPVFCPNLQVEMKAMAVQGIRPPNTKRTSASSNLSSQKSINKTPSNYNYEGSIPDAPYQATLKDKMRYHAITMMKEYENYSFEELRLLSPASSRTTEPMLIRQNNNGTFTATWSPLSSGTYRIYVMIDGDPTMRELLSLDVDDGPEGTFGLPIKITEPVKPASKMRKFKANPNESSGLRIRGHPTLQSEQLGQIPVNGIISFEYEHHNEDGIMVKLDEECFREYCKDTNVFQKEGWCLQYHQHYGKTFLLPLDDPKPLPSGGPVDAEVGTIAVRKPSDSTFASSDCSNTAKALRLNGTAGYYQVVHSELSGHNIRTQPSLRSRSVGILCPGTRFRAVDECYNSDGFWLKLDLDSQRRHCLTNDGEGWSLAVSSSNAVFLRRFDKTDERSQPGFDFSVASVVPVYHCISPPIAFGSVDSTPSHAVQSEPIQITPDTPTSRNLSPETPKRKLMTRKPRSVEGRLQGNMSKDSIEEVPVPPTKDESEEVVTRSLRSGGAEGSSKPSQRSRSASTFGALQKWLQMSTEGLSLGSGQHSTSPKQSSASQFKSLVNALSSKPPVMVTTETQTSPPALQEQPTAPSSLQLPTSIQFNIGSSGTSTLQNFTPVVSSFVKSPKQDRKRAASKFHKPKNRERSMSPLPQELNDEEAEVHVPAIQLSEAISYKQAESLRAVFGAVLWHAGIAHDAMACASYLRFQQLKAHKRVDDTLEQTDASNLLIQSSDQIPLRGKPRAASLTSPTKRHSVEVTSSPWLSQTTSPKMKHEELEFLSEMKSTESLKTSKKSPVNEDKPTDSDNDPPVAVSALKKIWDYIKQACSEKSLRDSLRGSTGSIDGTMKPSVLKLKRDRKISKGSLEAKIKLRKEKLRECQKRAGAFLLDLEEKGDFGDISQCEVCAVRFFNKGKSKKSFFGLSSLCENCSDRQLKLLRQTSHAGASKNSEPETFNSNCSLETQPHLMLLDNALFLLNMINTLPDRCEIMDAKTARSTLLLPVMKGFNSFEALGYSEIKVENEQEFGQADDEVNVSPNQFNFLETDDLTAEEKIALEDILSYPNSSFIVHTEADPTQNLRRRKTSNEEQNQSDSEGGFNLVNKPSPALQKFLDLTASSTDDEALTKLCGNVISFVSEKYDLKLLKVYLFLTIRKVTCRSYGLQMLTWLLRTVSQPTCLHDIFWWYASTFELRTDQREIKPEDGDNGWWQLRVHPLTDSPAAIFPVLVDSFYLLLETISGIMEYLPIGSPLLEMAVKTWGVSFFRKDHKFLQKCQIFQNLSKILSQFDGENEWSKSSTSAEFQERDPEDTGEITICYEDLTPTAEIKVSSRPALTSSLNDESTDTFWESGEEDRNRAKSIIIVTDNDSVIKTVGLYIDNVKDTNHRVIPNRISIFHCLWLGNLNHVANHVRPEDANTDSGLFFEVMEETVHGECETYYTVSQAGPYPSQAINKLSQGYTNQESSEETPQLQQQQFQQQQQQQHQFKSQQQQQQHQFKSQQQQQHQFESQQQQQHQFQSQQQQQQQKFKSRQHQQQQNQEDEDSSEESQELHQKYTAYKQLVQDQSDDDEQTEQYGALAPELFHKFCENQHQLYEITKAINFTTCKNKPVLGYVSPALLFNSRPGDNNAGSLLHRMVYSRYVACGKDRKSYTILKIQQEEVYKYGRLQTEKIVGGATKNVTLMAIQSTSRVPASPQNPKTISDLTYTFDPKEQKMRREGDNRVKTAFIFGTDEVEESQEQTQEQQQPRSGNWKRQNNRPRRSVQSSEESDESSQNDQAQYQTTAENTGFLDMPTLTNPPLNPLLASPLKIEGMKQRVETLLQEIVEDLTDKNSVAESETISKVAVLAKVLRFMKYSDIEELYHKLADKEQTEEDQIARNIFLDSVAIAGTNPNIKFLIDLVAKKRLTGEQAAQIIMTFSHYIRTPTQQLIKYFWEELVHSTAPSTGKWEFDQVKATSILTFTNLLHDACMNTRVMYSRYPIPQYGEFCNHNVVEREYLKPILEQAKYWVEQVVKESNTVSDKHWVAVYMTALGNIGHPEIVKQVQQWLDDLDDTYVKVKVVYALKRMIFSRQAENIPVPAFSGIDRKNRDLLTDEMIEKNVLPLLVSVAFDKTEDFEVRNAAISLLVRTTVADLTLWQKLAYMTWFEKDQQVHSYIFSIIHSLATIDEAVDPVTWRSHQNAKAVFHMMKPLDSQSDHFGKSSATYKSEFLPEYQSGFLSHFSYFGSLDSWLPNSVHYHSFYAFGNGLGMSPTQISIHSSSIRELINHLIGKFQRPSYSDIKGNDIVRQIVNILNIAEREQEEDPEADLHIKLRGEIERIFSVNPEVIDQWVETIKRSYLTQLRVGVPINYQKAIQLGGFVIEVPTILGVPATLHSRLNSLVSLRGTVKVANQNSLEDIQLQAELHPLHSWKQISKISFKVPFTGKKYEGGIQRHGVMELPFRALLRKSPSGELQFGITVTPLTEQKSSVNGQIQILTFHRRPYTSIVTDELWPVSHKEGGQMKIVHALETPFKDVSTYGEKELGIKLQFEQVSEFRQEREEQSAWMHYLNRFPSPSAWFHLFSGAPTIRLSERKLIYDVSASNTKTIWFMFAGKVAHLESKSTYAQVDSAEQTLQDESNQVDSTEQQYGSAETPYNVHNTRQQQQRQSMNKNSKYTQRAQFQQQMQQSSRHQQQQSDSSEEQDQDIEGQFQWPMDKESQQHPDQFTPSDRKAMFVVAVIGKTAPIQSPVKSRGIQKHLERDNLPSTVQFLFVAQNEGDDKVFYRFALGPATREAAQLLPEESQGIKNIRDALTNGPLSNTQVPLCVEYEGEYKRPDWANRDDLIVLRQRLLKEDMKVEISGKLGFGKACKSEESTIEFQGTMERDQEMTEYARVQSEEAQECNEDEKKGFHVSNICIKNTEEQASALNLIDLEFKSSNLPRELVNVTLQAEQMLKAYFWRYLSFNPVPTNTQTHLLTSEEGFRVQFRMNPDQDYVTFKVFKHDEIQYYENIRTNELVQNILPFTTTESLIENVREQFYGLSKSEVSCSMENSWVSTFDNVTFEFDPESTTDCLHVLAQVDGPVSLSVLAQNAGDKLFRTTVLLPANFRIDLLPPKDVNSLSSSEEDQNTERERVIVNGQQVENLPIILRDTENKFIARLEVAQDKSLQIFSPLVKVTTNGQHIVIYGSELMRNSTVGICGDFNGEKAVEFRSPRDCPLSNGNLLMASYAFQSWDSKDQGQCKIDSVVKKAIEDEEKDCQSQEFFLPEIYSDSSCKEKLISKIGDAVYTTVRNALRFVPGVPGKKWGEKARNKVRDLLSGIVQTEDIADIVASGIASFVPYVGGVLKPAIRAVVKPIVAQFCKTSGCCSTFYTF